MTLLSLGSLIFSPQMTSPLPYPSSLPDMRGCFSLPPSPAIIPSRGNAFYGDLSISGLWLSFTCYTHLKFRKGEVNCVLKDSPGGGNDMCQGVVGRMVLGTEGREEGKQR